MLLKRLVMVSDECRWDEWRSQYSVYTIPCLHVELYIYRKSKSKKNLRLGIGIEEIYSYKMLRDSCKDLWFRYNSIGDGRGQATIWWHTSYEGMSSWNSFLDVLTLVKQKSFVFTIRDFPFQIDSVLVSWQ